MGTKEKLEQEVLNLYNEYSNKIFSMVASLIDGNLISLAIELGEKFVFVCNEIDQDPRFVFMDKFKVVVNTKKSEMQARIDSQDSKREQIVDDSSKNSSIEQYKTLYMDFYHHIDKIQAQLVEAMSVKPTNEFEFFLNKSRLFFKSKPIRKFTPQEEDKITRIRSTLNEDQKKKIEKGLSLWQDLKLFDDYRLAIEYQLVEFEDKGWYNTVRIYCKNWLEYLLKIRDYHFQYDRPKMVKKIQEEIDKITDWSKRIENKYEKGIMLDSKQTQLLGDHIRQMIVKYREDRKELKRVEEDKIILKLF